MKNSMHITPVRYLSVLIVTAILPIVVLSSCSGDGVGLTQSGAPEGGMGFAGQIQPIFDTHCIRCHSPGGHGFEHTGGSENNGLDLTRGKSHNALVNQPTQMLPDVSPRFRVKTGDSGESYLIQKISSSEPKFGERMPPDGPPYCSIHEIQLVISWIEGGALND